MARFWSRVIQPFRAAPIDIKKKKLPVVAIHEYVKLITVQHILKDSIIYSKHLVRVEQLEKAYNQFKQKKYHWKQVDPFVQVWYEELERVCQQGQVALTLLQAQLEDLSHTLHDIVSLQYPLCIYSTD
jgi:galactokinase